MTDPIAGLTVWIAPVGTPLPEGPLPGPGWTRLGTVLGTVAPKRTPHEHKPARLWGGCTCGLQAGHPGDCEPQ